MKAKAKLMKVIKDRVNSSSELNNAKTSTSLKSDHSDLHKTNHNSKTKTANEKSSLKNLEDREGESCRFIHNLSNKNPVGTAVVVVVYPIHTYLPVFVFDVRNESY